MLQNQLAATAAREPDRFARALDARPRDVGSSIVAFLADAEAIGGDAQYAQAITGLRATGHAGWAAEFERARTRRMQQPNH
jgi:hypothetical protein